MHVEVPLLENTAFPLLEYLRGCGIESLDITGGALH